MTAPSGQAITFQNVSLFDPTTWVPTYGQYGGSGWSAGQRGATFLQIVKGSPVNALDELFKTHDIAYAEAEMPGVTNGAALKLQADETLLYDMGHLNYSSLPTADQTAAKAYAVLATEVFAVKLLTYDLLSVGETTIQSYVTAVFAVTGIPPNNNTGMTIPGQAPDTSAKYTLLNNGDGTFFLFYDNGVTFYSSNTQQQWYVPDSNGDGGKTIYSRNVTGGIAYGNWTVTQQSKAGAVTSTSPLSGTIPTESLTITTGSINPFITGAGATSTPPNNLTAAQAMALYEATGIVYEYGTRGNLTGFGVSAAEGSLSNSLFATAPQSLNPWPVLNTGTAQIR